MQPQLIGELVNAGIPIVGGIYMTLLGYRVVGKKPGASLKYDDWYHRYGGRFKSFGPMLILIGLVVGAINIGHGTSTVQPAVWERHTTSDGVCSIEFPGTPTHDTKVGMGVSNTRITLTPRGEDSYYTLTFSEILADAAGLSDEERLDALRDALPKLGAAKGLNYTFVRETNIIVNNVPGRDIEFTTNDKHVMRLKVFIVHGRIYRAIVVLPIHENGNTTMTQFLGSLRFEEGKEV